MNPVVHFEMPYDNAERMTKFLPVGIRLADEEYGRGDGQLRGRDDDRVRRGRPAAGARHDQRRFLPEEARLAGAGSVDRHRGRRRQGRDEAGSRSPGGQVLGEPMDIPNIGQYVSFTDTEGNRVSLLQPFARRHVGFGLRERRGRFFAGTAQMANDDVILDRVFSALADPTRRGVLESLRRRRRGERARGAARHVAAGLHEAPARARGRRPDRAREGRAGGELRAVRAADEDGLRPGCRATRNSGATSSIRSPATCTSKRSCRHGTSQPSTRDKPSLTLRGTTPSRRKKSGARGPTRKR